MQFQGTTVGGLSGIDYDPAADLWYALSDDGSDIDPARFYTFRLTLFPDRLGTPELLSVVRLRQPDGSIYPGRSGGRRAPDPESIRWRASTRTLLWADEGQVRAGRSPAVHEITAEGSPLRELTLPAHFEIMAGAGPRHNLGFEGLALTPDGASAWVAMEAPLLQDGPVPTTDHPGGPCRLTCFDLGSGSAVMQRAYTPDRIPQAPRPADAFADNGISEILMLDNHRMLVLERAFMSGVGNSLRLYRVDTRTGSDTMTLPRLQPGNHTACPKTLLLDFASLGLPRLDNTEAMAWGPRLPNGRRTLVLASDDNFNPGQITQFLAFEYDEDFS
jgi:hypothetical protein